MDMSKWRRGSEKVTFDHFYVMFGEG